ncbi:MAG: glucose-6-phosphate dehydrogenase [Nitrospiraceae bacterium]|nr:glucose-6-phosphate dehydrogenase [Nitrospiraceae bacterium]
MSTTQLEAGPQADVCEFERPKPFNLFIFGATGDLAKRKIFPALYQLNTLSLLPEEFLIIGSARKKMDTDEFRDLLREAVRNAPSIGVEKFNEAKWRELANRVHYMPVEDPGSYGAMLKNCVPLEERYKTCRNRIFYLAMPPSAFNDVIKNLGEAGAAGQSEKGGGEENGGYSHIVVEKPFGRDLESAGELNSTLRKYFREDQIYRMDHFLAKETVQNILMFRFSNYIFEPIWNNRYIDHVQITAAETLGIENRGPYYEESGVLRDMFQNHMLHLLALTAMEPPSAFTTGKVRGERAKALSSIKPLDPEKMDEFLALGQYGPGHSDGVLPGYRNEPGVSPNSNTATYAALKLEVGNWRWDGVPFYLRSGKRTPARTGEISIHFKPVPHKIFREYNEQQIEPNVLTLCIHPDEKFDLFLQAKQPGTRICLGPVRLDYTYPKGIATTDYARILLDCMQGDQMLFASADEVESSWQLLTPVIKKVESMEIKDFPNYEAGSSGPGQADAMLSRDGRAWDPL